MKSLPWFVLSVAWLLLSSVLVEARAVRIWSDQELLDGSGLVVVGTPIANKDTSEHTKLGEDPVVGVETQFAVSKVLKGNPEVKTVTVHHYQFDGGTMFGKYPNGPTLVSFDLKEKGAFRLFLVREADGRYAPVAGQMDAEISVHREPVLGLTIETPRNRVKASDGVSFIITFHNQSADHPTFDNNLLLNGGELLGNGAQIWSSVEAELKSAAGERIPMALHWGVPGIAGRIYFLGVPLRAGGSYALPVRPRDYLIGSGDPLTPGKYEIRCVYHGRQSPDREPAQMPPCWEGEVWSNTLKFEVVAK
jgi:hypothetical protein